MLSAVRCTFSAAWCRLQGACCTWFVACCLLHVVGYTLSAACCLLHVVCCMLPATRCPLHTLRRLMASPARCLLVACRMRGIMHDAFARRRQRVPPLSRTGSQATRNEEAAAAEKFAAEAAAARKMASEAEEAAAAAAAAAKKTAEEVRSLLCTKYVSATLAVRRSRVWRLRHWSDIGTRALVGILVLFRASGAAHCQLHAVCL
jgi:hypothetical protein